MSVKLHRICFIFLVLGSMTLLFFGNAECENRGKTSCLYCHADKAKMKIMGFPQLYVAGNHAVAQETDMKYDNGGLLVPQCNYCHKGDPWNYTLAGAHKDLLAPLVMLSDKRLLKKRDELSRNDKKLVAKIGPTGVWDMALKLKYWDKKAGKWKKDPSLLFMLWHDHNRNTAAYNPKTTYETCGICHPKEVHSYERSPMGGGEYIEGRSETVTQAQYETWLSPTGPHSCGIWTGKLRQPDFAEFTDVNRIKVNSTMTKEVTPLMMQVTQRNCNHCHVSCLDCHYNPGSNSQNGQTAQGAINTRLDTVYGDPQKTYGGSHRMVRQTPPLNCMGGGRSYMCHSGPLERRRGDGYIRGSYATPPWADTAVKEKYQDVHFVNGLFCTDCHKPDFEKNGHAAFIRDPGSQSCAECHPAVVKVWRKSRHKNLRCASCHTSIVYGYAGNFWVPGRERGIDTIIARNSAYQKDGIAPILLPDAEGMWAPYNPIPHIAGNIKAELYEKSRLRTQEGELVYRSTTNSHGMGLGKNGTLIKRAYSSDDAFVLTALYQSRVNPEAEGHVMAWINLDRVAHLTSGVHHQARKCEGCHTVDGSQVAKVNFRWVGSPKNKYEDVMTGTYTIIADKMGLRIVDMNAMDEKGRPARGFSDKEEVFKSRVQNFSIKSLQKDATQRNELLQENAKRMATFTTELKMAQRIVKASVLRKKDFSNKLADILAIARAQGFHGDVDQGILLLKQIKDYRSKL